MSPTKNPVELVEGYSTLREQRYAGVLALAWELGRRPLQREVSDRLSVSSSYAASLMTDPDGHVDRARKESYAGTCERCGGKTDGTNGRAKAPKVCASCLTVGPRPRVRSAYPVWNEAKCIDAIVRWVERNGRIPRTVDLTHAELGERPCLGTIMRYCYRYEQHEQEIGWRDWMNDGAGGIYVRRWTVVTHSLPDILVDLAPRLPVSAIVNARNAWVRMRLFEVIGIETIVTEAGTKICSDEFGVLWRIEREDWPEPVVMVEVVNSTSEPDGSFKNYFLRVPPDTATPRTGIAWTFDVEADDYELALQT